MRRGNVIRSIESRQRRSASTHTWQESWRTHGRSVARSTLRARVVVLSFLLAEAQRLQAICLHASVAFMRLSQGECTILPRGSLSPWQQELVQLVTNGLANEQIANACGITTHAVKKALERLFARMRVSSLTELAAKLGVRVWWIARSVS